MKAFSSAEPARVLDNYYTVFSEEMPLVCPKCHWTGAAKDGDRGEYKDLFDVSCQSVPKCCLSCRFQPASRLERQRLLGTSTLSIRFQTCSVARHYGSALKGRSLIPRRLPDLQEEEIDLVWDTENADEEDASVVIKAGDRSLARAPVLGVLAPLQSGEGDPQAEIRTPLSFTDTHRS